MADNLKGIPFNSPDEGINFPDEARKFVVAATKLEENPLKYEETYVVMFSYITGNYKALISTPRPDGRYFEVTFNKSKAELYVDFYLKTDQEVYKFHKETT